MKNISKLFFLATLLAAFAGCDKVKDLPVYGNGKAPALTASATTIAAIPADSLKNVLTLSWTWPDYATDTVNTKFVIQIDSTGKNFTKPASRTVYGKMSSTFTAKELNDILLAKGYAFNVPVDMDVRVISSYGNNNDQKISNTVKIKMTPYLIPPKVAVPASGKLFLVGSASQGGWNNPVPVPSQEFAKLDATTYAGIFQLNGGSEYLLLPVNGDWSHKYSVQDNTVSGLNQGGNFGYDLPQNIPGPTTSGMYRIVVDFQQGKFTVTPYTGTLPSSTLFIVGDATAGGWNNPVPVPSQQFTRVNSSVWQLTLPLTGGKEFLVLPVNGDWSKKYALKDNTTAGISTGGEFGYHQDSQPAPDVFTQNFKSPATTGTYTITLNFAAPVTTAGASGKFTIQ
jgi:starch-binding outer membrane protein SusE/F